MTNEEREMDLALADLEVEVRRLKKIEQAALAVVKSFSNSIDYNTWDAALDALEVALADRRSRLSMHLHRLASVVEHRKMCIASLKEVQMGLSYLREWHAAHASPVQLPMLGPPRSLEPLCRPRAAHPSAGRRRLLQPAAARASIPDTAGEASARARAVRPAPHVPGARGVGAVVAHRAPDWRRAE